MGMAASQARYLALTARKSNVEFQGQQVNQQRTLLAIEQGELFSELTKLKNPIPPSSLDYQYDDYTFTASDSSGVEYKCRTLTDSIKDTGETIEIDGKTYNISSMTINWTGDDGTDYEDTIKGAFIGNSTSGYSQLYITDGGAIAGLNTNRYVDSLKKGTWEDNDAYTDAMNQYNYEVTKYNNEVERINQKTEQIQLKDRTLELKLRNLDTEQNAIQTELESVKKVIEDTVKTVFKTFQSS